MYIKELITFPTTSMIIYINFRPRSKRVTLKTRKVLKIRTARKALTALFPEKKIISKMDKSTILPSKMFILSRK